MQKQPSPFQTIKRQVYRIALPFLSVSVLATYWLGLGRTQGSDFNTIVLPYLAFFLTLATVAIYFKRVTLEHIEVAIYAILATVLIAKFSYSLHASYTQTSGQSELVQIYIWTTVNFVLAYFLFQPRVALIGTSCVYLATLIAGIGMAFWAAAQPFSQGLVFPDRLFDFYLANAVELSLLFGLSNIHSRITALKTQLSQMEKLAHVDMLTGIANRRQIEILLKKELSSGERYGNPLAIILFDIDKFKTVNDSYGHDVGDYVLCNVAKLFSEFLRETDTIGRWGGEEFIIITSQTPLKGALLLAERLRQLLANYPFDTVGQITASFGVSSYHSGDSLSSLTKRADEALYLAKEHGRNRIEAVTCKFIEHIKLPELAHPFQLPTNFHEARAEQLNRATLSWLSPHKLASKKKLYQLVATVNPGWLAANLHESASNDMLRIISDWYIWMFLHDDRCDESEIGRNPQHLLSLNQRLLDILQGSPVTDDEDALAHLFFDLGQRLRTQANLAWFERFLAQVKAYFNATVWEANNRAAQLAPSLKRYTQMRLAASGVAIDTCFIEIADGIELEAELYQNRLVETLIYKANLIICWANDLYSLNKELHHHDVHNLISALQKQHNLPLQEAVFEAKAMHDQLVKDYQQRSSLLHHFDKSSQVKLERFFKVLERRISCNLIWSQKVARYKPSEHVRVSTLESSEREAVLN